MHYYQYFAWESLLETILTLILARLISLKQKLSTDNVMNSWRLDIGQFRDSRFCKGGGIDKYTHKLIYLAYKFVMTTQHCS